MAVCSKRSHWLHDEFYASILYIWELGKYERNIASHSALSVPEPSEFNKAMARQPGTWKLGVRIGARYGLSVLEP